MNRKKWISLVLLSVSFVGTLQYISHGAPAINYGGVDSPPAFGFNITPNDGVDLTAVTRAIYVGVSGDLEVIYAGNGADIVLHAVPVGRFPGRFTRVKATSTTATNLVGEY